MLTTHETPWMSYADHVLRGEPLTREEALRVLNAPDDQLLPLLHAAYHIRHHYFGNRVLFNMIVNAKSGLCPENCGYCSQSAISEAPVDTYPLLEKDTLVRGAYEALERKASTYCIVASGRGPSNREVDHVAEAVREIKANTPLKICACLGILSKEKADKLRDAGVDRYNHNVNTSAGHHSAITTSHTYEDRVDTVENAVHSGMSPCSGCIVGMGETPEDLYAIAQELNDLDADSIPVNFLIPIPGTPLENQRDLNPRYALKVLAFFRFMCPSKEIRISGGREYHLRSLQAMGLYAANAIFVGDYLTTEGQEARNDLDMIQDLGFEVEEKHPRL